MLISCLCCPVLSCAEFFCSVGGAGFDSLANLVSWLRLVGAPPPGGPSHLDCTPPPPPPMWLASSKGGGHCTPRASFRPPKKHKLIRLYFDIQISF